MLFRPTRRSAPLPPSQTGEGRDGGGNAEALAPSPALPRVLRTRGRERGAEVCDKKWTNLWAALRRWGKAAASSGSQPGETLHSLPRALGFAGGYLLWQDTKAFADSGGREPGIETDEVEGLRLAPAGFDGGSKLQSVGGAQYV